MNILYGLYKPDEGEILVGASGRVPLREGRDRRRDRDGAPALHADPGDDGRREHRPRASSRRRAGVLLDERRRRRARARALAPASGWPSTRTRKVENISVGQQQRVEILKALYRGAEILILDEPTAVLTPQEAGELFAIIEQPQGRGQVDHLHQPQAERGARDRRPDHRPAARQEDRHGAARGRDRGRPRADDGRARGAAAGREDAGEPGETLLEVEDLHVVDDRGCRRCAASRSQVRAGEIVGIAGRRRQRPERADRGDHGPAPSSRAAQVERRRTRASRTPAPARCSTPGSATSPRTGSGAGSCSSSRSPRTSRCTTTASRPTRRWGWLFPSRLVERARRLIKEFDVRGGGPQTHAGALSGGNQQKVVVGARGRARPEGADRGAADARARRRRDRVSCTGGSSRSATRAGRSCSSRSSWTRSCRSPTGSSSSTRAGSSASTRRSVTEEEIGLEMLGGRRAGDGGMSEPSHRRRRRRRRSPARRRPRALAARLRLGSPRRRDRRRRSSPRCSRS